MSVFTCWKVALSILLLLLASAALAYADDCGSPDDCFGNVQAAAEAAAGVAVTVIAFLGAQIGKGP